MIIPMLYSMMIWFAAVSIALAQSASDNQMPHLEKQGTATQLFVDGKPFLILGGELGNSAATSLESMEPIWPRLAKLNLNTVLVPAYWDLIEPREGEFDFALVERLEGAVGSKLRVVFLWFGSWKNSMSCYAPAWVKTNQERFPRSQDKDGRGMEILSPFARRMSKPTPRLLPLSSKHLREVDGDQHTVIMVQVENEIGMIPEARDWLNAGDQTLPGEVPPELMDRLLERKESLIPEFRAAWEAAGSKTAGTWEEVFGKGFATEEIFMAWYFARYTDRVTQPEKPNIDCRCSSTPR